MSTAYLEELQSPEGKKGELKIVPNDDSVIVTEPEQDLTSSVTVSGTQKCLTGGIDELVQERTGDTAESTDIDDVPIRFCEKKRLHWAGKTCECIHSR